MLKSELEADQWAVVSERGCEASGLKYMEALSLLRRLSEIKTHGLCIVTDAAARRLSPTPPTTRKTQTGPSSSHRA